MNELDGIRSRAEAYRTHGTPGLHAPKDRAVLLAALDAGLTVHQPTAAVMYSGSNQRMVQVCTGCGTDDGNWMRWPCPTVNAINSVVGGAV
jgi:hypothetical protein